MELLISRMLGAETADRSADLRTSMQKPVEWLKLSLPLKYRTLTKVINERNSNEKNTLYFVLHPSRSSLKSFVEDFLPFTRIDVHINNIILKS